MRAVTGLNVPVLNLKYHSIEEPQFFVTRYVEDNSLALAVMDEDGPLILSVNLSAYGPAAPKNCIYVRDYSENEGLADALVAAGVATKDSQVNIGYSTGWLMELNFDAESLVDKR